MNGVKPKSMTDEKWKLKDPCCYIKKYTDSYVFLLLYVDDMLTAGSSMREIINVKTRLSAAFEMIDLGPAKQILGMRISRDRFG